MKKYVDGIVKAAKERHTSAVLRQETAVDVLHEVAGWVHLAVNGQRVCAKTRAFAACMVQYGGSSCIDEVKK